jgi:hypothetical protein
MPARPPNAPTCAICQEPLQRPALLALRRHKQVPPPQLQDHAVDAQLHISREGWWWWGAWRGSWHFAFGALYQLLLKRTQLHPTPHGSAPWATLQQVRPDSSHDPGPKQAHPVPLLLLVVPRAACSLATAAAAGPGPGPGCTCPGMPGAALALLLSLLQAHGAQQHIVALPAGSGGRDQLLAAPAILT